MPIEPPLPTLTAVSPRPGVLFIFAHQDDEFGVYGYIAREVRSGAQVQCVYLTDGGWGNQDVARRNSESLAVLADLGVARDAVAFVGQEAAIGDGRLHRCLDEALRGLEALLSSRAFERVYMPAWEGGHQDHDAAHLIGLRVACRLGRLGGVRQYSLYNGVGLVGPLFRLFHPLAANGPTEDLPLSIVERVRYAGWLLRYRSQWKSVLGLLPAIALWLVIDGKYRTQPVSLERTCERPHRGLLLYERRTGLCFEEFERSTLAFREQTAASAVVRGTQASTILRAQHQLA